MSLFSKPCGCRGFGFLVNDIKTLGIRTLYDRGFTDKDRTGSVGTAVSGNFPSYTSTHIIEIEEEKEVKDFGHFEKEIKTEYLKYGCEKCGDTWREKYKSRSSKSWEKGDEN